MKKQNTLFLGLCLLFLCAYAPSTKPRARATTKPTTKAARVQETLYYSSQIRWLQVLYGKSISKQERAVLNGLCWVTQYLESDLAFEYVFCEYLFILKTIHLHRTKGDLNQILKQLGKITSHRILRKLPTLYDKDLYDKWSFLSALPMLLRYQADRGRLLAFYKSHFPSSVSAPRKESFEQALAKAEMDTLGDYLIETSFLFFMRKKYPLKGFKLPLDTFRKQSLSLDSLAFSADLGKNRDDYLNQSYFLTHVNAVLSNYGEFRQKETALTRRLWKYWEKEWSTIRFKLGDFDLLAELVFCYKVYGKAELPKVQEAMSYILKRQHPNGSWGTKEDFEGGHYQSIHPTWTALTALVTPNPPMSKNPLPL